MTTGALLDSDLTLPPRKYPRKATIPDFPARTKGHERPARGSLCRWQWKVPGVCYDPGLSSRISGHGWEADDPLHRCNVEHDATFLCALSISTIFRHVPKCQLAANDGALQAGVDLTDEYSMAMTML